jgi:hypothetical protein
MSISFTDYSNKVIDGQMCIWLQSYGWSPAKQMKDVKVGDICICNFGITEKIVGIAKETAKTIAFKYECKNGQIIDGRPRRKNTYIAIKNISK